MRRFLLSLFIALAFALAVAPVSAQPVDEAKGKELASEAMDHYKNGDFDEALELFKQARAIYPTAQVLRMTGYTLIALERWVEAITVIEEALKTEYKPLLPRDAEHAQDNLAEALKHVARVEIVSSVDGARLRIDDGEPLPLPHRATLEPGSHRFEVSAEGHEPAEEERDLDAGDKVTLELDPTPFASDDPVTPSPKPRPKPKPAETASSGDGYGWFPYQGPIGLGVAGLGLAFGIAGLATGLYGDSLKSAVQENINAHNTHYDAGCNRHRELCLNDIAMINRDGATAASTIDTGVALGITGAALFSVGAVLFLFSDDSPLAGGDGDRTSARCAPAVGPEHATLACGGRF